MYMYRTKQIGHACMCATNTTYRQYVPLVQQANNSIQDLKAIRATAYTVYNNILLHTAQWTNQIKVLEFYYFEAEHFYGCSGIRVTLVWYQYQKEK